MIINRMRVYLLKSHGTQPVIQYQIMAAAQKHGMVEKAREYIESKSRR